MLKKLAKYGNSTTLVIDKAILELLNMDESTMVKLHTDGKSLIITPVAPVAAVIAEPEKLSLEAQEMQEEMALAGRAMMEAHKNRLATDAEYADKCAQVSDSMQAEMKEVFAKHEVALGVFGSNFMANQGFQEACALLKHQYDLATQQQEYMLAVAKLRSKMFPELAEFDKDIAAVSAKYSIDFIEIDLR